MKPLRIGDAVGDYRVIDIAGSGGMGTVYKIEHVITRRIEAMKLLPPGASDDPDQVQRFEREIQVQARLHHPNIVGLYNAVRNGDLIALVMEFVEGESLQRILESGPLPVETAVDFTNQVLGALAYAHDAGVIHRDVAPANIIVTGDGTAKLTDFGLARSVADVRLSTSGVPLGSPWYMSPEQVRGFGALDARTDIYAMGAVLHEMLTGEKLFKAAGAFAVMRAHVEAEPATPSSLNPRVPPALDDIVRKAVAKAPEMRFQSAGEFRLALANAIANQRAFDSGADDAPANCAAANGAPSNGAAADYASASDASADYASGRTDGAPQSVGRHLPGAGFATASVSPLARRHDGVGGGGWAGGGRLCDAVVSGGGTRTSHGKDASRGLCLAACPSLRCAASGAGGSGGACAGRSHSGSTGAGGSAGGDGETGSAPTPPDSTAGAGNAGVPPAGSPLLNPGDGWRTGASGNASAGRALPAACGSARTVRPKGGFRRSPGSGGGGNRNRSGIADRAARGRAGETAEWRQPVRKGDRQSVSQTPEARYDRSR